MSLINDALKKVSEVERGKPQGQPVDFEMRAMQPAPYEKRPQHLLWVSIALLAGAVGVATFMFAKQRPTTVVARSVAPKTRNESAKVMPVAAPAPVESPKPQVAKAVSPASISPAAPTPAPVPVGPSFRLKGILYTKNNPTALINEASVSVGGEVDGATVTKIEATMVALEYEGKAITLKLGAK